MSKSLNDWDEPGVTVPIPFSVRASKRIVAGVAGSVSMALASHASATTTTNQLTPAKTADNFPSSEHTQENWTSFRGPGGNGHAARANPPLTWSVKEGRNILWKTAVPKHGMSSPVSLLASNDYLILPTAFGVVSCLDARTGRALWEHEFDKGFFSSPILVKDRVYLLDRSGGMQVFRMAGEFELLGVSEIGEDAYATPAFVDRRIFIRGVKHLFCIEEQK